MIPHAGSDTIRTYWHEVLQLQVCKIKRWNKLIGNVKFFYLGRLAYFEWKAFPDFRCSAYFGRWKLSINVLWCFQDPLFRIMSRERAASYHVMICVLISCVCVRTTRNFFCVILFSILDSVHLCKILSNSIPLQSILFLITVLSIHALLLASFGATNVYAVAGLLLLSTNLLFNISPLRINF